MAEFCDILKDFKRMCNWYGGKCKCGACPMDGDNISQCRKILMEKPEKAEKIIGLWALDHPEPRFKSWYEFLEDVGIVKKIPNYIMPADMAVSYDVASSNAIWTQMPDWLIDAIEEHYAKG